MNRVIAAGIAALLISLRTFGSDSERPTVKISTQYEHNIVRPVLNHDSAAKLPGLRVGVKDDVTVASEEDFGTVVHIQKRKPHTTTQDNILVFNNTNDDSSVTLEYHRFGKRGLNYKYRSLILPADKYTQHEKKFLIGDMLASQKYFEGNCKKEAQISMLNIAQIVSFTTAFTIGVLCLGSSLYLSPKEYDINRIRSTGINAFGIGFAGFLISRSLGALQPQPFKEKIYEIDATAIDACSTPQEKIAVARAGEKLLLNEKRSWYETTLFDICSFICSNTPPSARSRVNRLRKIAAEQEKILESQTAAVSADGSKVTVG
jgi:hypothetical protein